VLRENRDEGLVKECHVVQTQIALRYAAWSAKIIGLRIKLGAVVKESTARAC
jgi:hypothetical protein